MKILSLEARSFRNHRNLQLDLAPHINLITGPNGAGKTNLIDAIHYLCMSRSFVTGSNQYVVQKGAPGFSVKGRFEGSIRKSFQVGCRYGRGEGKKITVNDSPLDRFSDLIGMVPVVVLSPDDRKLTAEGPVERRSFLDSLISQLSSVYLSDLIAYRKIIRQRNRLLAAPGLSRDQLSASLEPWNNQLVRTAARIVAKRQQVTAEFSRFLEGSYQLIAGLEYRPHFTYKTFYESGTATGRESAQAQGGAAAEIIESQSEDQPGPSDQVSPDGSEGREPDNPDPEQTGPREPGGGRTHVKSATGLTPGATDSETLMNEISEQMEMHLEAKFDKEREREQTLTGPHRDDLIFYLDDLELRKFGSQGQHRMFALALKLAQLKYYSEMLDDLPLFLLDDVFGDLDPQKTGIILQLLAEHEGQTFITAANEELLCRHIPLSQKENLHLRLPFKDA